MSLESHLQQPLRHPPPKKKVHHLANKKKQTFSPFSNFHPSSKSRIFPWSHIFFQLQPLFLCFLQPSHGIFQLFLHPQDLRAFAPWQIHLGPTKAADGQIQGLPRRRRGGRHGGTTGLGDRWNGNEERIHGYLVTEFSKAVLRRGGIMIWKMINRFSYTYIYISIIVMCIYRCLCMVFGQKLALGNSAWSSRFKDFFGGLLCF